VIEAPCLWNLATYVSVHIARRVSNLSYTFDISYIIEGLNTIPASHFLRIHSYKEMLA
jgi:hypothetical protein